MSYTTVYGLWPHTPRKPEALAEYRNSHGFAAPILDTLAQRYLGAAPYRYFDPAVLERLWKLPDDPRLSAPEKIVLLMTFDRAYVLKKDFARAVEAIHAYFHDKLRAHGGAMVNHWLPLATLLESDPDCAAIGFQTSLIADEMWLGDWDDAIEDYGPLDWSRAFDVFGDA